MTSEEFKSLRVGDRVLYGQRSPSGCLVWVTVVMTMWAPMSLAALVRRVGRTKSGQAFPEKWAMPKDLKAHPSPDGYKGNVYADWLEEQGEQRAADLLRAKFPLDDGGKLE